MDYLESAANCVVLHTASGNHVVRDTLLNLEAKLPPRLFLRISRSVIVNVQRVKALQSTSHSESVIVLHDSRPLLATRGVRQLQERLHYP